MVPFRRAAIGGCDCEPTTQVNGTCTAMATHLAGSDFAIADLLSGRRWPERVLNYVSSTALRMPDSAHRIVDYMIHREAFMFDLIGSILQSSCPPLGSNETMLPAPVLFVDSGAHEGMWSLLAGAMGCHVISVEPQPGCVDAIRNAMELNHGRLPHLPSRVSIWPHFLSAESGASLLVPRGSCHGDESFVAGDERSTSVIRNTRSTTASSAVRVQERHEPLVSCV